MEVKNTYAPISNQIIDIGLLIKQIEKTKEIQQQIELKRNQTNIIDFKA